MAATNRRRRDHIIRLTVNTGSFGGYSAEISLDNGKTWNPVYRETSRGSAYGSRREWRDEARARGVTLWEPRPADYASKRQTAAA